MTHRTRTVHIDMYTYTQRAYSMADQEWSQLGAICDLTAFRQACNDSHSANMVHNWDLWCQK